VPDTPEHVLRRDWHFANACDAAVVVLPADERSCLYRSDGTFIEIGWAVALGKPLFVLTDRSATGSSYLFDGLLAVSATTGVFDLATEVDLGELARSVRRSLAPPASGPASPSLAFCATSFGFGPVSKAVAIARAIRETAPRSRLVFFGSDVAEIYARSSDVFDEVRSLDTDAAPDGLAREVAQYDGLINSLSFDVLECWTDASPPQFFVDSLAWMWPTVSSSLAHAHSYLVQDYLLDATDSHTQLPDNALVVPPIVSPAIGRPRAEWEAEPGYVLVHLGGCRNPILLPRAYERYVTEVLRGLVESLNDGGHDVRRVLVCGNEQLMTTHLGDHSDMLVECRFLPHAEFLLELRRCERLITSPGLTTTLEALALNVPCQLLLPQNYSQFRIDRHYRSLGLTKGLWPETIDSETLRIPGLDEAEGVKEVARLVDAQLATRDGRIKSAIGLLLRAGDDASITEVLRSRVAAWDGSRRIAEHVIHEIAIRNGGPGALRREPPAAARHTARPGDPMEVGIRPC